MTPVPVPRDYVRLLWDFYRPLFSFTATMLFIFASALGSWLQVPLALGVVLLFVEVVIDFVRDVHAETGGERK